MGVGHRAEGDRAEVQHRAERAGQSRALLHRGHLHGHSRRWRVAGGIHSGQQLRPAARDHDGVVRRFVGAPRLLGGGSDSARDPGNCQPPIDGGDSDAGTVDPGVCACGKRGLGEPYAHWTVIAPLQRQDVVRYHRRRVGRVRIVRSEGRTDRGQRVQVEPERDHAERDGGLHRSAGSSDGDLTITSLFVVHTRAAVDGRDGSDDRGDANDLERVRLFRRSATGSDRGDGRRALPLQ